MFDIKRDKKIIILSTDTLHHRYFIAELSQDFPIEKIFFEKTEDNISQEQRNFEQKAFGECPVLAEEVEDVNALFLPAVNICFADVIVVFGTRRIKIPQSPDMPKPLMLNVHRGILPNYRGLDSNLWALYYRDFDNVGVTIHHIDRKLDTGDIICQKREIKFKRLYQERYYTTILAVDLMKQALKNPKGTLQTGKGKYFSHFPQEKYLEAQRHLYEYHTAE